MGSTETSMKKNMCTGIVAFYCLLYPEQTQYCKLEFLNNTRFCRNDLSNWKDERSTLFCLQEPLVWLSIAPNVIITEGINYLSATSHNFQICFKIASSSMPVNKSVLGKKRAEQSLCNIASADRHLQKLLPLGHRDRHGGICRLHFSCGLYEGENFRVPN